MIDKLPRLWPQNLCRGFVFGIVIFITCFNVKAYANKNILIVGDSISAAYGLDINDGWVNLFQLRLAAQGYTDYVVINASISGNTSGDGLSRLPQLLDQYSPEIVIIELGGNDGLRGYPIKLMTKNLQKMIDLSQSKQANVVLAGIEIPPNYGQRYTDSFRRAFQTLAANNTVVYIPFILEGVALKPELMQNDGIHPTAAAQPKLLNTIWQAISQLLDH